MSEYPQSCRRRRRLLSCFRSHSLTFFSFIRVWPTVSCQTTVLPRYMWSLLNAISHLSDLKIPILKKRNILSDFQPFLIVISGCYFIIIQLRNIHFKEEKHILRFIAILGFFEKNQLMFSLFDGNNQLDIKRKNCFFLTISLCFFDKDFLIKITMKPNCCCLKLKTTRTYVAKQKQTSQCFSTISSLLLNVFYILTFK